MLSDQWGPGSPHGEVATSIGCLDASLRRHIRLACASPIDIELLPQAARTTAIQKSV